MRWSRGRTAARCAGRTGDDDFIETQCLTREREVLGNGAAGRNIDLHVLRRITETLGPQRVATGGDIKDQEPATRIRERTKTGIE